MARRRSKTRKRSVGSQRFYPGDTRYALTRSYRSRPDVVVPLARLPQRRLRRIPLNLEQEYLRYESTPKSQQRYKATYTPGLRRQKIYDPAFCRKVKNRRMVMFAMGLAGTGGKSLSKPKRRRRAARYRDTWHNRIKC